MPGHNTLPLSRWRRRTGALRNGLAAVTALAAVGALIYTLDQTREPDVEGLTVIAVEPRDDRVDALASDATAQLDQAANHGNDVLLVSADSTDAGRFHASFACSADATDLRCQAERAVVDDQAQQALAHHLEGDEAERVDLLAPLRRTAEHLAADPVNGDIDLYLNLTGRHDDPVVDLTSTDIDRRGDELVDAAREHERLPESCADWRVHAILPTTGDPSLDVARADVLGTLVESCGGTLEIVTERWLADGTGTIEPELVDAPIDQPTDEPTESAPVVPDRHAPPEPKRYTIAETLFDVASAELRPGANAALDEIADTINDLLDDGRKIDITVNGYADDTGPNDLNDRLSQARADEVAGALTDRVDLPEGTISAQGHGSLDSIDSEEARQGNRRVDIIVSTR